MSNEFLPSLLTQSLSDKKGESVQSIVAKKEEILIGAGSRNQLARGRALYEASQNELLEKSPRQTYELVSDSTIGMTNMVDSTASALGAIATHRQRDIPIQGVPYTDTEESYSSRILKASAARAAERNISRSGISRANNAIVDADNARDADVNSAWAANSGLPSVISTPLREIKNFGDAVVNSANNPTTLFDDAISSSPTLLLGPVAKGLVSASSATAMAAKLASRQSTQVLTNQLRAEAAKKLAVRNMAVLTGVTEGASNAGEVAGAIYSSDIEELADRYPQVRIDLNNNVPEEIIKDRLAAKVGMTTGILTAVATGAIAVGLPGFNMNPLGRIKGQAGETLKDLSGEFVEESFQSGAGSIASDIGQAVGGADVDIGRESGIEAGRGGIAGLATAVGARVPSLGASTAALTGSALVSGAKGVANSIIARGAAKFDEAAAAGLAERTARSVASMSTAAAATKEWMATAPTTAPDLSVDPTSPIPEGLVQETDPANPTAAPDVLTAHTQAVTELFSTETTPERRTALQVFISQNANKLQGEIDRVLRPAMEAATDQDEKNRLSEVINHLSIFTESSELKQIRDGYAAMPETELQKLYEALPEDVISADQPLSPVTQQALATLNELSMYAPEKLSVEFIERGLAQRSFMNSEQRRRLEAAYVFAQQRIKHDEVFDKASKLIKGGLKNKNVVRDQIASTGFAEAGNLLSVSQHFAGITEAMAQGNIEAAKELMAKFGRWVTYASDRANKVQQEATRLIAEGSTTFEPVTTKTLNENGKPINIPFQLNVSKPGSLAMVDVMIADADMISEAFNGLTKAYPELGTERVFSNRLARTVADFQARKINPQLYTDVNGNVQLREFDKMHPNQAAVSVIRGDGKPMTAVQFEKLLNGEDLSEFANAALEPAKGYWTKRGTKKSPATQVVQLADGTWRTRQRKAGQWQPWQTRETFDPSGAYGYRKDTTDSGFVTLGGEGRVKVNEPREKVKKEKLIPTLLHVLSKGVGLNREAFRKEGMDPAEFSFRIDGFNYLFRKNGGMNVSELREWLQSHDYLVGDPDNSTPILTDDDAYQLLLSALNGEEVYAMDQMEALNERRSRERYEQDKADAEREAEEAEAAKLAAIKLAARRVVQDTVYGPSDLRADSRDEELASQYGDDSDDDSDSSYFDDPPTDTSTTTPVDDILNAPPVVNFNDPTEASKADLDVALNLTPEQYFERVNPSEKITEPASADQLVAELEDKEIPERAEVIKVFNEDITFRADGNYLYAEETTDANGVRIVGVLGVNDAGVEFVVHPELQGQGLGRAMMKELLVRNPFASAGTGGMSDGAKATRLSALAELRAEIPVELADRFRGLIPTLGTLPEKATPADVLKQTNRILNVFSPIKKAKGLFARMRNASATVLDAIKNDQLHTLLPKGMAYLLNDYEDVLRIQDMFAAHVPDMVKILNRRLNASLNKPISTKEGVPTVREVIQSGSKSDYWNLPNQKALHAVVLNEDGTASYHPEIAEAMALAAIQWSLENADRPIKPDFDKIGRDWGKRLPATVVSAYTSGHYLDQGPRAIARSIQELLGLQTRTDVPLNQPQEVMAALALEALQALTDKSDNNIPYMNTFYVRVGPEESGLTNAYDMWFGAFDEGTVWKDARIPKPSRNILSLLLNPESPAVPSIGKAHKTTESKIVGRSQLLSEAQKVVLQKHNDQGLTLNTDLLEFVEKIGWDVFKKIRGFTEFDKTKINKNHAKGIAGLNSSIEQTDTRFEDLLKGIQAYAKDKGVDANTVKVYWKHYTASNGRVMAHGVSPQSDKTFRELMSLQSATIKKGNEDSEIRLFAAIAQGLGLAKLEKVKTLGVAADTVANLLTNPATTELLAAFQNPGSDFISAVEKFTAATGIAVDTTKALHALFTLSNYQAADPNGDFTYSLTAEIDGVNNGPHNAHMQFMGGFLTESDLRQMEQGGVFIGRGSMSLSSTEGKAGDRYQDASIGTHARSKFGAQNPDASLVYRALNQLLNMAGLAVSEEGTSRTLGYSRSFGKEVLVPVGYMSGLTSVARKLAGSVVDSFYEELSNSLKENRSVDPKMIAYFKALLRNKLEIVEKELVITEGVVFNEVNIKDRANFTFTDKQMEIIVSNVESTVGKDAYDAAVENMGKARKNLMQVVTATQMLAAISDSLYTATRDTKIKELQDTNQIGKFDGLSQQQEQDILNTLRRSMPIIALSNTDNENLSEGLSGVIKDKGVPFQIKSTRNNREGQLENRNVTSMDGTFKLTTNRTGIGDPGVSLAPTLVIATGDVATVHETKMDPDAPQMLSMWDGFDTLPELMEALGLSANKAVFNSWNYSALDAVVDMVNRLDTATMDSITEEMAHDLLVKVLKNYQLDELGYDSRNKKFYSVTDQVTREIPSKNVLSNHVADMRAKLIKTAKRRNFMWTAMKELGVSVDQMAGSGVPYFHEGTGTTMTPAEVVAAVNARVAVLEQNSVATPADREKEANALVSEMSQKNDVRKYSRDELISLLDRPGTITGKLNSFIWKMMKPLIPDNLQMYMGKQNEIYALHRKLVPNSGNFDRYNGFFQDGLSPMIFITDFSPITLLHEVVHAATSRAIYNHYNAKGKGLNVVQRSAINNLERLAKQFVGLKLDGDEITNTLVYDVQQTIKSLLDSNDMYGAVSEFIAYTMSEKKLQKDLGKRTFAETLRGMQKKVVGFIREILGLPNNTPVIDWLTVVSTEVFTLVESANIIPLDNPSNAQSNQQATANAIGNTDPRLANVAAMFNEMLALVPDDPTMSRTLQNQKLAQQGAEITREFLKADFDMDAAQRLAFQSVQMVFASTLQLNSEILRAVRKIYENVMPQITEEMMMDDPTSTANQHKAVGRSRLLALQGDTTTVTGSNGRANHLANFMALALVDDNFRTILSKIEPPKILVKDAEDAADLVRNWAVKVIDYGSTVQMQTNKSSSQLVAMDVLASRLRDVQVAAAARNAKLSQKSLFDQAEANLKTGIDAVSTKVDELGIELLTRTDSKWRLATGGLLTALAATTSNKRAEAWQEAMVSLLNSGDTGKSLREVMREILGTVKSAYPLAKLLNQSKQAISTVRQRLREETPKQVKKWFKKPLDKKAWQRMHTLVGDSDIAAIWGKIPVTSLLPALVSDLLMQSQIKALEDQLQGNKAAYLLAVDDLAHWMINKETQSQRFLYRNAHDMARLYGTATPTSEAFGASMEPILDQLVTLRALQKMSVEQRKELHDHLSENAEGMDKLITTMKSLTEIERAKGDSPMNQWKGYTPTSSDPRKQVRLANPEQAQELLRTGWEFVGSYKGDANDITQGLAYYASTVANEVTYNQGALQMVVQTAGGMMQGTGQSLSNITGLNVKNRKTVDRITAAKLANTGSTTSGNMIPIFRLNEKTERVEIIAYERTLDAGLVKTRTRGDTDLAVGLGIWMGRQAEETLSSEFNDELGDMLKEIWLKEQNEKPEEYYSLNNSKDPIDQGTWEAIPEHTKAMLKDKFGDDVMVRRDMRNNSFGYRSASIRDIFTGYSGLDPTLRKNVENLALGLFSKDIYKYLAKTEDLLTALVGGAKDIIVVRSGIVGYVNLLANQLQMLAMGIPVTELARQFDIAKEIEAYQRNEHRLARIQTEMRADNDPAKQNKLAKEAKILQDENSRMSIAALIQAGELPTITEGLSETDEYTLISDAAGWIENRFKNIPPALTTAAKYAVISKDTALYQGMNRMIQYGDLMAKQLVYEKLTRDGLSKEDALREIQETFVNYNILPGRTRTALENMGVLWFWNYKLRIQKIFFRTARNNPLRALLSFTGADLLDVDSLYSSQLINTNLSYSIGPGQLARAHEMFLWEQF